MRTASVAHLEGAVLGEVLTIVRGSTHFSIPSSELDDLLSLIGELAGQETHRAARAPAAPASAPAPVAAPAPKAAAAPAPAPAAPPVAAKPAPAPKPAPKAAPAAAAAKDDAGPRARRGRVWEGVKQFLAAQDRPAPFDQLLKMVKDDALTDRDPAHALRIAIGKKVSAGELVRTKNGRYALPEGAAPTAAPPAAPTAKAAPAAAAPAADSSDEPRDRRHRPGELWKQMHIYLKSHPEGLTRDELVVATRAHRWTNADAVEHAVKICLSRVRSFGHVEEIAGGRWRLIDKGLPAAAEVAAPAAASKATVTKRKKQPREPTTAEQEPAPGEPGGEPSDGEGFTTSVGGQVFNASLYYPRPRSKRPR